MAKILNNILLALDYLKPTCRKRNINSNMNKKISYQILYNRFGTKNEKLSFWLDFSHAFNEDSFQAYNKCPNAFSKKMFNIFPNSIIYVITTANNYLTDTVTIWLKCNGK